jgi:hypothetical protein
LQEVEELLSIAKQLTAVVPFAQQSDAVAAVGSFMVELLISFIPFLMPIFQFVASK